MKVIPFKIPQTGKDAIHVQVDKVPHFYNHLHQHEEIQLTLIIKSEGTMIAGDYVSRFTEGDVYVIGSNQPHVFRNDISYFKRKKQAESITVFFDENTFGKTFWQAPEIKSFQYFFRNSNGGFKIMGRKKEALKTKLMQIADADGFDKLLLFIEIIKLLSNKKDLKPLSKITVQRSIKTFDGNRLNNILEFIFKESHRSIKLNEIASVANLTPVAFCKYFKTRTRKTYVHFLNEIRINNACQLLMNEDIPVTTVCYRVGFNNLSNFNKVFKKITGKTPKAYKQID